MLYLETILQMVKLLVQIIDSLVICLHWWWLASGVYLWKYTKIIKTRISIEHLKENSYKTLQPMIYKRDQFMKKKKKKRNSYPSRCCSDELTMYNVCTHSNVKHPQKQQPSLNLKFFWGSPSILNKSIKVSHLCHTPTNGQTLNSYLQHINNAIIA